MAVLVVLAIPFIAIPAMIAFAVPGRYYGFLVVWFVMLVPVGGSLPTTGPDHSSPFAGTGDAIYGLICGLVGTGLAIRGLVLLLRPRPSTGPASPLAWAATGALAAACGIAVLTMGWSDRRPVWLVYTPALTILIGSLVLAVASIWIANVRYRGFAWGLAVSAVVTFGWSADWTARHVETVVDQAERTAGDRPYCIQVVTKRQGYSAATVQLEFSPVTMRAPCPDGWCWRNHAILAIRDGDQHRLMNWSHHWGEFRDDVLNAKTKPPAVVCQPAPHFARELPLLLP